jgi:hypothetical protein
MHQVWYDFARWDYIWIAICDSLSAFIFLNLGVMLIKNSSNIDAHNEVRGLKMAFIILNVVNVLIYGGMIAYDIMRMMGKMSVEGNTRAFWVILVDSCVSILVVIMLSIPPCMYVHRLSGKRIT